MIDHVLSVATSVGVAAVYSVYQYITKTTPEKWDPCKLLRTLVAGLIVGIILLLTGQTVTQQTVQYLLENSSAIWIADSLIKKLIWKCK